MCPSPTDSSEEDQTFVWENATQAFIYRVAKVGATQDGADLATTAQAVPLGILQNNPAQNEAASIRNSGLSYVEAGAAITIGQRVVAMAGGKVTPYTRVGTWSATASYPLGTALSAASGDTVYITLDIWRTEGQL